MVEQFIGGVFVGIGLSMFYFLILKGERK